MNLITGGLGFIGNELARQWSRESDVTILDSGHRIAQRIEDVLKLPREGVDLTDHAATAAVVSRLQPRTVVHLAAIHYIPECNANPERTLRVNTEATLALLRACADAGVQHFLYASSGAVYADSPTPLVEGAPVGPVDIYGLSKLFGEQVCQLVFKERGLPITVCRLFNNVGPRETNAHIVPEIVAQLKLGSVLRLGNIDPRRDYIHTADTARALRLLARRVPEDGVRTLNIASGHHASVREIVDLMGEILCRKLVVETDPSRFRKADKQVQVADTRLLRSLIGWSPQYDLRSSLKDILQFEGFET